MRYYSGELGRWASRDPVAELISRNLAAFLNNDPYNLIDLLGLADCLIQVWIGHNNDLAPLLEEAAEADNTYNIAVTCSSGDHGRRVRAAVDDDTFLVAESFGPLVFEAVRYLDANWEDLTSAQRNILERYRDAAERIRELFREAYPDFNTYNQSREELVNYFLGLAVSRARAIAREQAKDPCCSEECPDGIKVKVRYPYPNRDTVIPNEDYWRNYELSKPQTRRFSVSFRAGVFTRLSLDGG